jgi:2-amino-4-hydroxy-6-hydroxymethyldihydropteridine diphosphokinase
MEAIAYIALGANLGDRRAAIERALDALGELGRPLGRSALYETEPVGGPGPDYLNAAAALATTLEPEPLLDGLLAIEARAGRRRGPERNAPRPLDLDLLLVGDRVLATPRVVLPHPRMHERRFVLAPLAEIAPEAVHPLLHRSITELLAALPPGPRVRRI